ncbi:MAG: hypothetical protein JNK85_10735 [Verrucomicrobiales bacterium]|nr:hypothetical protein [Verrucomicrobiales bacterium]
MRHWKVIVAAGLIFGLGVVTGMLAQRTVNANSGHGRGRDAGMGTLLDSRFAPLQKMQEELLLSPEQAKRIDAILHDGQGRMRQFWDTCQPRLKAEMKQVREGISAELTPEQRGKFDELLKRHRELRVPRADKEKNRGPDNPPKKASLDASESPAAAAAPLTHAEPNRP